MGNLDGEGRIVIEALITFLGGSAFRMVWGEVSSYFTRRQEHAHELATMQVQADLEASRHGRDMERIKLTADLGVREIQVAGDVEIGKVEADAWLDAVRAVAKPTGIAWVDAWNGAIRPGLATLAAAVVAFGVWQAGSVDDWTQGLVAAILGVYVADRSLAKRGK